MEELESDAEQLLRVFHACVQREVNIMYYTVTPAGVTAYKKQAQAMYFGLMMMMLYSESSALFSHDQNNEPIHRPANELL